MINAGKVTQTGKSSEITISGPITDADRNNTITMELHWDSFSESGMPFSKIFSVQRYHFLIDCYETHFKVSKTNH